MNVGVVLYAPKAKYLNALCSSRYGRISKVFPDVDGEHFSRVVRYIQAKLEEEGDELLNKLQFDAAPNGVKEFVARILPVDDTSLQFSPEGYGLTENPAKTLEQLYTRYVEKYYEKTERQSRTDEDVWKVYKKSLEGKRVFTHLKPHQIIGKNYDYEFKHSWKNEKLHANEPISFDLIDPNEILDKAHKWLGRIESLVEGGEEFKLTVLLGSPRDERVKSDFIKAQNILTRMPCESEFVKEEDADTYADNLRKEIEEHDQAITNRKY